MPHALVTGGAGLLGRHLISSAPPDWRITATVRRAPLDARVAGRVEAVVGGDLADTPDLPADVDLVLHTAYSASDLERDVLAATQAIATHAAASGAALVHLSSDTVFDGEDAPYAEGDRRAPVSDYGRAKSDAEDVAADAVADACIVRTSLLMDTDPLDPRSDWVAGALRSGEPITLFTDEFRCPIAADDLARQIWDLVGRPRAGRAGAWHLVGPEAVSRYSIGVLVAAREGLDPAGITPGSNRRDAPGRPRDLRLATTRPDHPTPVARSVAEVLAGP